MNKKIVAGVFVAVLVGGAAMSDTDDTKSDPSTASHQTKQTDNTTDTNADTNADTGVSEQVEKKPTPKPEPEFTAAQENAIDAAQGYLDYTAFSRSGLIQQLKFEKYPAADAEFAVAHMGKVDWNAQAKRAAVAYLDYTSFSLEGLVEQLKFEGYTDAQARYGASAAMK